MEKNHGKWNCKNCGRSNDTSPAPDGQFKCEFCAETGIPQSRRSVGEVLRRWTAGSSPFNGQLRPRSAFESRFADGCRVNLVAEKLRSIKTAAN